MKNSQNRRKERYDFTKRLIDLGASSFGILVISPILIAVATAIAIDDPGSVIFKQKRAGKGHLPFTIYKFRTMRLDTPDLSTEEMRLRGVIPYTRLGLFLRRTSLDELPQLFNVLKGEMSLVGPRPALLTQTVVLRGRENFGIDQLRPGMTGLAQITGRDDLEDEEKIRRDNVYLTHLDLATDLILLIFTFKRLFKSKGVY